MARNKKENLSIRTTPEIKGLLRLAAERERRSVASMIEALVVDYARQHQLIPAQTNQIPDINHNHSRSFDDIAVSADRSNEEGEK